MYINVKFNHVIKLKQNCTPLISYPCYPYLHGDHGYGYRFSTRDKMGTTGKDTDTGKEPVPVYP